MLELCRTTEFRGDQMDIVELLDVARLTPPPVDEGADPAAAQHPPSAECVLLDAGRVVGFGRLVWSGSADELPQIRDLAVVRAHRTSFIIQAMEEDLIDEYALNAEGGVIVLDHSNRQIDISPRLHAQMRAQSGHVPGRSKG